MRKITVFVVLLALLALSFPVHAQEEGGDYPPCTEEEINTALEILEDYAGVVAEDTADYDVAGDPNDMNYVLTLVAYDTVSSDYWNTIAPSLPECIEAQTMAYLDGSTYDLYLTVGLLFNLAAWTGDPLPDTSAVLFESAELRLESLTESLASAEEATQADAAAFLSGMGFEAACTSDKTSFLVEHLNDSLNSLSAALETAEDDPTEAFVQTEELSSYYNSEVFGRYFSCAENYWLAWKAGALLTNANITVGLLANAAYEEDGGNTEVAAALTESANARLDNLMASIEELTTELDALPE